MSKPRVKSAEPAAVRGMKRKIDQQSKDISRLVNDVQRERSRSEALHQALGGSQEAIGRQEAEIVAVRRALNEALVQKAWADSERWKAILNLAVVQGGLAERELNRLREIG